MHPDAFVDYYADLQINTNADFETVERIFRLLAKRYHPDNDQTGDSDRFNLVSKAFEILSDPEKRAAYDAEYENKTVKAFRSVPRAAPASGFANDQKIRDAILSIMYIARRQNVADGGVGAWRLEQLLEWPEKELEFHIWYLKEKSWIQLTDTGGYTITATGVDAVEQSDLVLSPNKLLPEKTPATEQTETSGETGETEEPAAIEAQKELAP
jgi:hypothetical protein